MYCKKCGYKQKEGQIFCPKCGTPFVVVENVEESNRFPNTDEVQRGGSSINETLPPKTQSRSSLYKILIVLISLAAVIGIIVWGWNNLSVDKVVDVFSSYEKESDISGIPFKSSEKGKWGMLKPDGTILFEEEFKDRPTVAREGRFFVKNGNDQWEIFTAEEKPQKVGDEYKYLGMFYNGVAPAVKNNEHITLIDKDGNVVKVLDKSGAKPITKIYNFSYGYALFEAEDAIGIVNTRGDILLEARKYCAIFHVAPKTFLALDMKYKDEDEVNNIVFDVIDPVGNKEGTIRMAKYNNIKDLDDGYIGIEQTSDGETLYGIMDLKGEIIVRPTSKIKEIKDYRDGKYFFYDGQYYGVRNVKDEVLIRAKYDEIDWASSTMVWAISIDEGRRDVSLIDLEGNKITQESYIGATEFFDGKHSFVQITDKTWGIINKKGEELKDAPDIYTISWDEVDHYIKSDYLDMDAIVSAIRMTPNGFGGFGINMSPIQLIKNYNENCEDRAKIALDPHSARIDRLSYQKEILNGVEMKVELYYRGYMTENGESYYDQTVNEWIQQPSIWTKEHPQYIKMSVTGNKLEGKTNILYKKLLVKAKAYGQIYKENDNACIIVRKNQNGIIIVNTGSEVWAMVKDIESLKSERIEQYSQNETYRGANFLEYADSEDIDY